MFYNIIWSMSEYGNTACHFILCQERTYWYEKGTMWTIFCRCTTCTALHRAGEGSRGVCLLWPGQNGIFYKGIYVSNNFCCDHKGCCGHYTFVLWWWIEVSECGSWVCSLLISSALKYFDLITNKMWKWFDPLLGKDWLKKKKTPCPNIKCFGRLL